MHVLIGGAFQGKRDYACSVLGVPAEEIYVCTEEAEPDWNARCLEHLERYVYYRVKNGLSVEESPREDAVVLCDDIFCGVVPIDPVERAWREETGRMMGRLSRKARRVTRLFCGLPMELK